jgi:hypothetical protein
VRFVRKIGGIVLAAWGAIRIVVDSLESIRATASYARIAYVHVLAAPSSTELTVVVIVVGSGLIFSDEIKRGIDHLRGNPTQQLPPAGMGTFKGELTAVKIPAPPRPAISVEVRQVKIKPDHLTVVVGADGQLRCECNAFVETYIVNTVDVPTTIKTADLILRSPDSEYRGSLLTIGNDFEIVRDVKGWQGALATVFGKAQPLEDLAARFNSKVFDRYHGTLGWLRFSLKSVLTDDLERLKSGEGATATVIIVDALGDNHQGTCDGPWQGSGTVVKRPRPGWESGSA